MVTINLRDYPRLHKAIDEERKKRKIDVSISNPHRHQQMQVLLKEQFKIPCKIEQHNTWICKVNPRIATWIVIRWM